MTCKNCINSDVCNCYDDEVTELITMNLDGEDCGLFKDKSLFVELPCKVGDTVWFVGCNGVKEKTVRGFYINKHSVHRIFFDDYIEHYYDKIFPTRDEAEKALAERSVIK